MEDNYRHKGLRKKLVDVIKSKGISDAKVLAAMEKIPRHWFIDDSAFVHRAYEDSAFPIGEGQTISQPFTVAYQTELLQLKPGMKVLEIGTGSGYQACVLAEMDVKVFTIERHRKLFDKTKHLLLRMNYSQIKTFYGDGFAGIPTFAPFDRVLITAAAPEIPQELIRQLKTGGQMVIPLDNKLLVAASEKNATLRPTTAMQIMLRLTKQADGSFTTEEFDNFSFVPMLPGKK